MDLDDFIYAIGTALVIIVAVISIVFGGQWVVAGLEVPMWNKLNGTSYTQYEWFCGGEFIRNYQGKGEVKTIHLKSDNHD